MTVVRLTNQGDDARAQALATLVSAFVSDPVERWLYPDARQYLTHFPEFLAALGGKAFDEQTVWSLAQFGAVALWLPPGTEPEGDDIISVLTKSVSAEKHVDMFSVLEQMTAAHPAFAHWYLPWFGVDAAQQGKGLGGQLLKTCLAVIDDSHLPAYLETPNPRNISFYERHGFAVTGQAQAGSCPAVAFMLRASR
jgi:ribosomal protein S18 acetylase RimI-like enzyme